MSEPPECLACGACCFSQLETYVRVTGDDYARLGARAEALVAFHGNRAYLRMVEGHCAALVIEPRTGQLVCSAYVDRPQICRELSRGSPECAGERAEKAERPPVALSRARALPSP